MHISAAAAQKTAKAPWIEKMDVILVIKIMNAASASALSYHLSNFKTIIPAKPHHIAKSPNLRVRKDITAPMVAFTVLFLKMCILHNKRYIAYKTTMKGRITFNMRLTMVKLEMLIPISEETCAASKPSIIKNINQRIN
jgi:hypothetical protein